jgi:signal transduction histidine kinase
MRMLSLSIFLFITLLMIFLAGAVYAQNATSKVNKLFFITVVFMVIWMVTNYLETIPALPEEIRAICLRLDFTYGSTLQVFLMLFVLTYVNPKVSLRTQALALIPICTVVALTLSPWHVSRIYFSESGEIRFEEGPTFPIFAIFSMLYFLIPCGMLLWYRRRATGALKGQATAISIGLAFMTVGLLGINLFLQNVLPVELFRFGNYSVVFFVIGVAYAIVRHSFLRIRFVVTELFLLAILSMLLSRVILATSAADVVINLIFFFGMVFLGFSLVRSVEKEIEQRKKLQTLTNELQAANEKLRILDAQKTEFLSIASHQLRTPLSAIRGYVDLMIDGTYGKVTVKQKDAIDKIHGVLGGLIDLVAQLLSVSRIESGRTNVEIGPTDLMPICKDVASFLAIKAKEEGLTLECHDAKMPLVLGDADKLKEVMMNLTENALKYTDEGGVAITLKEEPDFVRVEVKDTGIGIAKENIVKLFQKFSRIEATTAEHPGTGLGLYVCKRLVDAMGGEIWVESKGVNKGSSFIFRLQKAPKGDGGKKKTVKVV